MEITLELIVFTVLALFIGVSAILAVTTRRILRAATYLLFVLFGTAGIYFQLNYSFLGAVQLLIYAGGITVLYVFSILLTSSQGDKAEDLKGYKLFVGLGAALEAHAIARLLRQGRVPFCYISAGNRASLALQKKLGLCLRRDLYWLGGA